MKPPADAFKGRSEDLKDGWVNMRFMEEDAGP